MPAACLCCNHIEMWLHRCVFVLSIPTAPRTCCLQMFVRAVAEAREMHDRRKGIEPATNHKPFDFLAPHQYSDDDTSDNSDSDNINLGAGVGRDLRPPDAQQEHARRCSAQEALTWLHLLAQGSQVSRVRLASLWVWQPFQISRLRPSIWVRVRAWQG